MVMWLKMIFVVILLLQYSMTIETAELECPPDQVRLIGPDDVNNFYVEQGLVDFTTLLSHTPGAYFQSSTSPNTGNLTFSEPFLLLGFTTQGVTFVWVSTFTFQYSDSLDGPYQTYQTFQVNTTNEMLFVFQEPILAQRIQLLVSLITYFPPLPDRFYWRMNLFGCAKADATSISQPMETSSVCPDPTVIPTVSQTTCIDPPVSSPVPVFITVTTIIKETPVDQESDNCQMELIIGITAPVGTILILIVFTIIVLIVCIAKKGKSQKRTRSNTLKEVPNLPLYAVSPRSEADINDHEMVYNDMYSRHDPQSPMSNRSFDTSSQDELLDSPINNSPILPHVTQENVYSEVDHYHLSAIDVKKYAQNTQVTQQETVENKTDTSYEMIENPAYNTN